MSYQMAHKKSQLTKLLFLALLVDDFCIYYGQPLYTKCCTTNYKYCLTNSSQQCSTVKNCTEICGGAFIDASLQNTSCLALKEDCSNNFNGCCGDLTCTDLHYTNQTYQCLINDTEVPSSSPPTAPTKKQLKGAAGNQTDAQGQKVKPSLKPTIAPSKKQLKVPSVNQTDAQEQQVNTSLEPTNTATKKLLTEPPGNQTNSEGSQVNTSLAPTNSLEPTIAPTKKQLKEQSGNQTTSFQNTSCLASNEGCSNDFYGCCGDLTCAEVDHVNQTYQCIPNATVVPSLALSSSPTVSQTNMPTAKPTVQKNMPASATTVSQTNMPAATESACCSFNYKDCSFNTYCNSNQTHCETSCVGKWLPDWRASNVQNCLGLNEVCGNSTNSACCNDLQCKETMSGYMWQCQPTDTNSPTPSPVFQTLAPTNASTGECCSFDYKTCDNNDNSISCGLSKGQCEGCSGFWIDVDPYQNASCIAMYQRCSKTLRCCAGSCIYTDGFGDKNCQPIFTNPPTRGPASVSTKMPTESPLSPEPTKSPLSLAPTLLACCSWDYKTCIGNDLCDASQVNCKTQCAGAWLDNWTKDLRANCLIQNANCINSPDLCCSPLSCVPQYGNETMQCQIQTSQPSVSPSYSPSQKPTTAHPTAQPAKNHTASPTNSPSVQPNGRLTVNPINSVSPSAFPSSYPSTSYPSLTPSKLPSSSPTGQLGLASTSNALLLTSVQTEMNSVQMSLFESVFEEFLEKDFGIKGVQCVQFHVKITDQMLVDAPVSYSSRSFEQDGGSTLKPLFLNITVTMEYRIVDQSTNSTNQLDYFDELIPIFVHDREDVLIGLLENEMQVFFSYATQVKVVTEAIPKVKLNEDEPSYIATSSTPGNSTLELQHPTLNPMLRSSLAVVAASVLALFIIAALKINETYKARPHRQHFTTEGNSMPFYNSSPPCMKEEYGFQATPFSQHQVSSSVEAGYYNECNLMMQSQALPPNTVFEIFDCDHVTEQASCNEHSIGNLINDHMEDAFFVKRLSEIRDTESLVSNITMATMPATSKLKNEVKDGESFSSELDQSVSRLSFPDDSYNSKLFDDHPCSKTDYSDHLDLIKEESSSCVEYSMASYGYQETGHDVLDNKHVGVMGKCQEDDDRSLDSYSDLCSKIKAVSSADGHQENNVVTEDDEILLEIGSYSDFCINGQQRIVSEGKSMDENDSSSDSVNSLDSYNALWSATGTKATALGLGSSYTENKRRNVSDVSRTRQRGASRKTDDKIRTQRKLHVQSRSSRVGVDAIESDIDSHIVSRAGNDNDTVTIMSVDFGDERGFGTNYC